MDDFIESLKEWEKTRANPVIYDNIDSLFPEYQFRRICQGSEHDRWISPLKIDLSRPKTPNREKTVIGIRDLRFREQGEWDNPVSVIDRLKDDWALNSIYEVYREVARRFCLDMPSPTGNGFVVPKRDRKLALLNELESYFVWNLENNSSRECREVNDYIRGRGFSEAQAKVLRFGYVPTWEKVEAYITSERKGFTKDELSQACQVYGESGRTSVGNRHKLAIPYRCNGILKGFLFRAISPDVNPKYIANTGLDRKSSFFNMPNNVLEKEIVVVEGEMDAITATVNGFVNTVAVGGSEITSERRRQVYDAIGHKVRKMTLCFDLDADKDGKPNYRKRYGCVKNSLHNIFEVSINFDEVYVAVFPEPTDPDEYLRRYGKEAFERILNDALHWTEYLRAGSQKLKESEV